jgi:hypothetical protein
MELLDNSLRGTPDPIHTSDFVLRPHNEVFLTVHIDVEYQHDHV